MELRYNGAIWLVKEFEMEGVSKFFGEALDTRSKEVEKLAAL